MGNFVNFCWNLVSWIEEFLNQIKVLTNSNSNLYEVWFCLKFNCEIFPFTSWFSIPNVDSDIFPGLKPELDSLVSSFSSLALDLANTLEDDDSPSLSCEYYDCDEFNTKFFSFEH